MGAEEVAAVHALAGALGGLIGLGLFYPLDVLRSLVQLNDPRVRNVPTLTALLKLWQQGGVLWQGVQVRARPPPPTRTHTHARTCTLPCMQLAHVR